MHSGLYYKGIDSRRALFGVRYKYREAFIGERYLLEVRNLLMPDIYWRELFIADTQVINLGTTTKLC